MAREESKGLWSKFEWFYYDIPYNGVYITVRGLHTEINRINTTIWNEVQGCWKSFVVFMSNRLFIVVWWPEHELEADRRCKKPDSGIPDVKTLAFSGDFMVGRETSAPIGKYEIGYEGLVQAREDMTFVG